jgi:charged multivesicular body protein 2A
MDSIKNFFVPKKPEELIREYKRSLDKTIRELDRERAKLQQQEKKLLIDMRRMAGQNQMDSVRIMARDLVRTRRYITRMYKMRAEMQAVSLRLQTLKSTQAMTDAMKGVTRTMVSMNQKMNLPAMQKVMMEFARQNEVMGMKEEMIADTIDDAMDEGGEEEESEEMVAQVLDEIGLDFNQKIGASNKKIGDQQVVGEQEEDDLQARLDKLRKS